MRHCSEEIRSEHVTVEVHTVIAHFIMLFVLLVFSFKLKSVVALCLTDNNAWKSPSIIWQYCRQMWSSAINNVHSLSNCSFSDLCIFLQVSSTLYIILEVLFYHHFSLFMISNVNNKCTQQNSVKFSLSNSISSEYDCWIFNEFSWELKKKKFESFY